MGKRVAVIGTGASGLAAIHRLTAEVKDVDVVAFERNAAVGGVWVYTEKTGIDEDGLPVSSSMYNNVRTNLPKDCMKFFDYPHKSPYPSFMGHTELREYLQSYAEHFKLHQYIKLKTIVTRVVPVFPEKRDTKWEVTFCQRQDQDNTTTEVFDYVVVCSGHNAVPDLPSPAGLDKFKGELFNSHNYRVPEKFKGQTVVCVGSGPSAMDLSIDLQGTAEKVFLSMDTKRRLLPFVLPAEVSVKENVDHVTENSVIFANGEEEKVDVIILCAGYQYTFPFLTETCDIVVMDKGHRVTPLYKHTVNIEHPTMLFLGIQDWCNIISVSDIQAQLLAGIVSGDVTLTSKEEMEEDTKKDFENYLQSGMASQHYHKLLYRQFELMDDILDMLGKPRLPTGYADMFKDVTRRYSAETLTYRKLNIEVTGDTYRITPPSI